MNRTFTMIAAGAGIVAGGLIGSVGVASAGDADQDRDFDADDLIEVVDTTGDEIDKAAGTQYPQVPLGWRQVALEWDDGVISSIDALQVINHLSRR